MKNSSRYFGNYECESFPCHKTDTPEDFNCLFCYCPLYHLEDCGGNYTLTDNDIKDCSACLLPHQSKDYEYIINRILPKK